GVPAGSPGRRHRAARLHGHGRRADGHRRAPCGLPLRARARHGADLRRGSARGPAPAGRVRPRGARRHRARVGTGARFRGRRLTALAAAPTVSISSCEDSRMTPPGHKGRGAVSRPPGRYAARQVEPEPSEPFDEPAPAPETTLRPLAARGILSRNDSPDVPFERSINPYQGCEHGCIYCYARPSHSYYDLSPGLDFETQIFYKPNAVELLLAEWSRPGYECKPITIGANTDPYQPAERRLGL